MPEFWMSLRGQRVRVNVKISTASDGCLGVGLPVRLHFAISDAAGVKLEWQLTAEEVLAVSSVAAETTRQRTI